MFPSVRTTPESTDLQALLAVMRERGADAVVMEVSSIAVSMGRVDGLPFDVVGFTNLSQDHLDFHGDMEAYFAAKAALFTPAAGDAPAWSSIDDEYGRRLAGEARIPVTTVSDDGPSGRLAGLRRAAPVPHGVTAGHRATDPAALSIGAELTLPGRFNVANALLAVAMLVEAGSRRSCRGRRQSRPAPACPAGWSRSTRGQAFAAVVDYAHTPDAVRRAAARPARRRRPGGCCSCSAAAATATRPSGR